LNGVEPGVGAGAIPGFGLGAIPGFWGGTIPGLGLGAIPGLGLGLMPGVEGLVVPGLAGTVVEGDVLFAPDSPDVEAPPVLAPPPPAACAIRGPLSGESDAAKVALPQIARPAATAATTEYLIAEPVLVLRNAG
jgi:hypothetical protein